MSAEYKAKIVVGLPFTCFPDQDAAEEWAYLGTLDRFASYYNAPNAFCILGLTVDEADGHGAAPLPALIQVDEMRQFKEITGLDGALYLTLSVF